MAVPFIFQNATGNIPLAELDTNFNTPIVLGSTTITLGSTVTSLSGFSSIAAATGTYSNLAVSGTVSGTGFSTYLASPPIIGSTAANAGFFTSLTSSLTTILNGTTIPGNKTLVVTTDIGTSVQENLVSGTNLKTINSTSLLGSGDVAVQATLVSGTNIKTINSASLLGSGDIAAGDVTLNGTQTLTNKTFTGFTETVFAVTGTTPALSPTNGTIQTWTLSANSVPTQGTWGAGASLTLMVNDTASTFTVNWASIPVVWVGGAAPLLTPGGGFTVIELWKVGTTVYGALVGQVA